MPQNRAHVVKADRRAVIGSRDCTDGERLVIVSSIILICIVAVFSRLVYIQLICHSEYLARAARQQQRTIEITPKRGSIYDRNMHPLAMSIPVDSVFAVPIEVGDAQLAAQLLSRVLGTPSDLLETRLASPQGFVWIARKVPPDKKEAVEALNLKGIYFQKENQRIYPKRDLAAHVLGFVDLDEKGLGGIEYELDKQIRGKSEKIVVMADARQRWFDGGEAQRETGARLRLRAR
jgi:cell division protein FtsI (penicillin-binding protein 3)